MTRIAFAAPMKPPDHPTPSGDRRIARLTLAALERAGFAPFLASRLRTLERAGDAATQRDLADAAEREAMRLAEALSAEKPALWFSYHCYYKAPDLVGPAVARRLGLPYAISEPSISPRRRDGPWARHAAASEAAIAAADRLFWTTDRDRPALEAAGHGAKMRHLPAFLDPGPDPAPKAPGKELRLVTVAMMRPGDKLESYRRLAAALPLLERPWRIEIIGDGEMEPEVRAMMAPFGARVGFAGRIDEPAEVGARLDHADVMVWPGIGEGVGMAWLEAMAAGTPVAAERGPAAAALIPADAGVLAEPGDPQAMAGAIAEAAGKAGARAHILAHHGIDAAAEILGRSLRELIA